MDRYSQAKLIVENIENKRSRMSRHVKIIMTVMLIISFLFNLIQGVDQLVDIIPSTIVINFISVAITGITSIFDIFISWRNPLLRGKSEHLMYVLAKIKEAEEFANAGLQLGSGPTVDNIVKEANLRIDDLMKLLTYESSMSIVVSHTASHDSHNPS